MGDLFYPEFVPNQILTDTQLNQLRDYLEREDRLTRSRLVGIGIACGLGVEVDPPQARITVRPGVGITSDGHLIVSGDETVYTHVVDYDDPDRDAENRIAYEPWRTASDPTRMRRIERLVSDAEMNGANPPANATRLRPATLDAPSPWVIALYLEHTPVELNSCLVTACDNKGRNVELHVRALLVSKADVAAVRIVSVAPGMLRVPRLHARKPLPDINGATALNDAYRGIVEQVLPTLRTALAGAFDDERCARFGLPKPELRALDGLLEKVDQYRYDALKDLVQAHNEAEAAACALAAACCPAGDFPRHLLLGAIDGMDGYRYRHTFLPAGARDAMRGEEERVRRLFLRIVAMLRGLAFRTPRPPDAGEPVPAAEPELRIVPSHTESQPLGKRALPSYFAAPGPAPDLEALWQPRLPCTADQLWSYQSWGRPGGRDVDHDDYARATWLRIEGHVGADCDTVESGLDRLRRETNTEFHRLTTWFGDPAERAREPLESLRNVLGRRHALFAELRSVLRSINPKLDALKAPWKERSKLDDRALELDREWRTARGARALHCDAGALLADYAAIRSALLCTLGRLAAAAGRLGIPPTAAERDRSLPEGYEASAGELLAMALAAAMQAARSSGFTRTMMDALETLQKPEPAGKVDHAFRLWLDAIADDVARVRAALPTDLACFDLALATAAVQELVRDALSFDLARGEYGDETWQDPEKPVRPAPPELRAAVRDLALGGRTCLLAQLGIVYAEYEAVRAGDASLFRNLVQACPGVEHLAGVAKGGTFVTVCEASDRRVVADFALAARVSCCCCRRTARPCVDPVATIDVAALRVPEDGARVSATIAVLANDVDPNMEDGTMPVSRVTLLERNSDLGATISVDPETGRASYGLGPPIPGAIDRFSYAIQRSGQARERAATGEVLVLLWRPRLKQG